MDAEVLIQTASLIIPIFLIPVASVLLRLKYELLPSAFARLKGIVHIKYILLLSGFENTEIILLILRFLDMSNKRPAPGHLAHNACL